MFFPASLTQAWRRWMLQRFLDWIDEAASSLIRLTYLLAGITAVAVYFGAGHLPGYIEEPLNAMLPWLLAFSVETHTYLCLLYTSDAADERSSVDLGGRRII